MEEAKQEQIWVLWWKYGDGSNQGIERTYADETRAREDLELLDDHSTRDWFLDQVPLWSGRVQ